MYTGGIHGLRTPVAGRDTAERLEIGRFVGGQSNYKCSLVMKVRIKPGTLILSSDIFPTVGRQTRRRCENIAFEVESNMYIFAYLFKNEIFCNINLNSEDVKTTD